MIKNIIIIILAVALMSSLIYTCYDKLSPKENINNDIKEEEKLTYSDIKGLYEYTSNQIVDEAGNSYTVKYNLYLDESGTFNYKTSSLASTGIIGNYVIIDNNIILNYLFKTNSGASIDVTNGTKKIIIKDDGSLVDENVLLNNVSTNITLTKSDSNEEQQFLQTNDISNILSNYEITNNKIN